MKKISKLLTLILCAVLLSVTVFTGCGGGESELIFNSADLESAVVGVYYSADLSENVDATHGSFTHNAAGTITIKPGENVITISIKDNTLMQGTRVGGPSLDYIELGTDTISWRPCEYNFK